MRRLAALLLAGAALGGAPPAHAQEYARTTVLVRFVPHTSRAQRHAVERAVHARELRAVAPGVHVLRVRAGTVRRVVGALSRHRRVRYAEPNYMLRADAVPDDADFGDQWALRNTAQAIPQQDSSEALGAPRAGTAAADISATAAWNVTTGSRATVIGVVDTGLDYHHPDLAANVWSNPGGIGGCPAGTHGYNAIDDTCDPMDDDTVYAGHGTAVAGVLGAVGDNAIGVAGVNWSTTILPIKWLDSSASGTTASLIAALEWLRAAKRDGVDVRVVNDSATFVHSASGVGAFSQALSDEIDALGADGILFVTPAGNTGSDNDDPDERRYPCAYGRANELCVTATDDRDELPGWAGFGAQSVDLAAPGTAIRTTFRNGAYGWLTGGSLAAPMVAGAAALRLAAGDRTLAQLKAELLAAVDPLPSLSSRVRTGGRLDLCTLLPGCGPPPTVIDAGPAATTSETSATLRFHSPDPAATFACRVDAGAFEACGSPRTYTGLADGHHSFEVRATDARGHVEPTAQFRAWTVERPAPPTTTAPTATTTTTTAPPEPAAPDTSDDTVAAPEAPAPPARSAPTVISLHSRRASAIATTAFTIPGLTVHCGRPPCRMAAVARHDRATHGSARTTHTPARIRLSAAARRALRRNRSVTVTVTITVTDAAGARTTKSLRVILRRH